MSSIGPALPPHLTKRKRQDGESPSPSPPSSPDNSDKRRRLLGPTRPPPDATTATRTADTSTARPRVLGPSLPPAPLSERPDRPPSDSEDSSSDDDFGPAPPPPNAIAQGYDEDSIQIGPSAFDTDPKYAEEEPKAVQRDEWMMMPPSADDLAARMDPTKLRARKFNSGKGARAPGSGPNDMAIWTETPKQKRKRLENEVLGKTAPTKSSRSQPAMRDRKDEATAKRVEQYTEQVRGKSLAERHREKGAGKEKEDDPSKRTFDYEKDMAAGTKISHKQRKELLDKAKGFGDRFAKGSFL